MKGFQNRVWTEGFSDGSKAGIGIFWGKNHLWNVSEKLQGRPSRRRAQLMAVTRALEIARENDVQSLEIYTDSESLARCYNDRAEKWRQNNFLNHRGEEIAFRGDWEYLLDRARIYEVWGNIKLTHASAQPYGANNNYYEADVLAKDGASQETF